MTIPELQQALDAGVITSRQLVERYLERVAAFDDAGPQLNGIREIHPEALGQATASTPNALPGTSAARCTGSPCCSRTTSAPTTCRPPPAQSRWRAASPTVGLVSRSGVIPLAPSWDTTGPMTRNVTDAAIWLGATVGVDERDPATAASGDHLPQGNDYRPYLDTQALAGARLGVQDRDGLNAVMTEAVVELERQGATIVDIEYFNEAKTIGLSEYGSVSNEFKTFLNDYLATEADPPTGVESLADIIAFNQAHPDRIPYGQKWSQISQTQPGIRSRRSRPASPRPQRRRLSSIPPWSATSSMRSCPPARRPATRPSPCRPAPRPGGAPVNLAFLGAAWSEPQLLGFAYDYEQATLHRVPPTEVNDADLETEYRGAG